MVSSHKKLDVLISLLDAKQPFSPQLPPANPPSKTSQSMGGLVLTPGVGASSVPIPSAGGNVRVLSAQLANFRPKVHALTLYHCIHFVRAFIDKKNMSPTIDSSLVQFIGQDAMETILIELYLTLQRIDHSRTRSFFSN